MPHETQTQPKPHEDPLNTGAIALDEANKTIRKKTAESVEAGLSQGIAPSDIISSLLQTFGQKGQSSPVKQQDLLKQVTDLAATQIPGEKKGIISGPLSNLLSGKLSLDRSTTEPLGIDDAIKVLQLQNQAQQAQRERPKNQADLIRTLQQIITSTPEGSAQFETAKRAAKVKFERAEKNRAFQEDIDSFIQGFEVAEQELIDVIGPEALESGIGGKVTRGVASLAKAADLLPKSSAFVKNILVNANKMARTIEGGRVTDADRQVYADAIANSLAFPSEENTELVVTSLRNMRNKGGDINRQIQSLLRSKSPTLSKAGAQLFSQNDIIRRRLELMKKQREGVQ